MRPFMVWAGSKRKSLKTLLEIIPAEKQSALRDRDGTERYYEPFLGSGALLLALEPRRWVVGDNCEEMCRAWLNIATRPEHIWKECAAIFDFLSKLKDFEDLKAWFFKLRALFNALKEKEPLSEATIGTAESIRCTCFFLLLTRFSFSNLYNENLSGGFNVPMGEDVLKFPPELKLKNLSRISAFLTVTDGVFVFGDWRRCLSAIRPTTKDMLFVDPPYINSFSGYSKNRFSKDDQRILATTLGNLARAGLPIAFCNYYTAEFHEWLGDPLSEDVRTLRDAAAVRPIATYTGKKDEVIFCFWGIRDE